jgi:hypothetical protein
MLNQKYHLHFCYLLLAWLSLGNPANAQLVLSEVMADPAVLSDIHGEFLEWANLGDDSLRYDSLVFGVDGSLFHLSSIVLGPKSLFLLCRDSLVASNGGMVCNRQLSGLSLANGRELSISWLGIAEKSEFILPPSRPGISWENTMEKNALYRHFMPSSGLWIKGDSATPGTRNSRSVEKPKIDLGITDVTLDYNHVLKVQVQSFGEKIPQSTTLSIWLDEDWDGGFETFLDSIEVDGPFGSPNIFSVPMRSSFRGIIQARLGNDENPQNNFLQIKGDEAKTLVLSEWCPAPESGAPEWVEISNATADSGGQGRTLSLGRVSLNDQALGDRAGELAPGEFLVLTESIDRFRIHYGALKVRLLQLVSWPSLRNTGDTLKLKALGILLDSATYSSDALHGNVDCLTRSNGALLSSSGTPGFSRKAVEEFSWKLSGRVAGEGRSIEVEVNGPIGCRYSLKVFDLEGNVVRDLGTGESGRHLHSWAGLGNHGEHLSPGPYLFCLSVRGHRTRRQAVAVTGVR